jgi:hypothetical protein
MISIFCACEFVSCRIHKIQRVITDVSISIQRLRVGGIGDDGVWLRKSAEPIAIESRLIIHPPNLRQISLPGIPKIGFANRAHGIAHAAEGQVARFAEQRSAGVERGDDGAEMIGEEVGEGCAIIDGYPLACYRVVAQDGFACAATILYLVRAVKRGFVAFVTFVGIVGFVGLKK